MAERTCITTRQTLASHRLIRFVAAPDGYAVPDLAGRLPGRGAWVTATQDEIITAEKRGLFRKNIGCGLYCCDQTISTVASQLRARALSIAGLARRAGILLGGSGKLQAEGRFIGLLVSDNASLSESNKLRSKLAVEWVAQNFSAIELGQIFGRDSLAYVGVRACSDRGTAKLSTILRQEIVRLDGFYGAVGCNNLPDGCIT